MLKIIYVTSSPFLGTLFLSLTHVCHELLPFFLLICRHLINIGEVGSLSVQ